MRIVQDTCVWVSALRSPDASSAQVVDRCLAGSDTPLMGAALLAEYEAQTERGELWKGLPISLAERRQLLADFLAACQWQRVWYLWRPNLPDEGDNHVLDLAIAGGAQHLVTHNVKDFTGELRFALPRIVTPAQHLKLA